MAGNAINLPGSAPSESSAPGSGYQHIIQFATKGVQPPSPVYIGVNDSLQLFAFSVNVFGPVLLELRLLLPDGTIQVQEESLTVTTAFTALTKNVRLAEGYLLSVSVSTSNTSVTHGSLFVAVRILRGFPPAGTFAYTLTQGYITPNAALSWPFGTQQFPTDQQGGLRGVSVANPAAGADWSLVVPANLRWSILGVQATLVTNATVANRAPSLQIQDPVGHGYDVTAPGAQAASQTIIWNWTPGGPEKTIVGVDASATLGVPTKVGPAWVIRTVTSLLQAGDQWSTISLVFEEWLDV